MKNFLFKEIRLCLAPINYVFLLFSCMILIPNYPGYVPFFYICLSVFFIFSNAELNKDIPYSMILPITKNDIVKSRCIIVSAYEILTLIFTSVLCIVKNTSLHLPNDAGIDANFAFFGLVLICLSVFNFTFFTTFYKKADKPGFPFFKASMFYWGLYLLLEFPIWAKSHLPTDLFIRLDSVAKEDFTIQLPIFIFGLVFYIVFWIFTYKISAKKFQKVDL